TGAHRAAHGRQQGAHAQPRNDRAPGPPGEQPGERAKHSGRDLYAVEQHAHQYEQRQRLEEIVLQKVDEAPGQDAEQAGSYRAGPQPRERAQKRRKDEDGKGWQARQDQGEPDQDEQAQPQNAHAASLDRRADGSSLAQRSSATAASISPARSHRASLTRK